MKLELSKLINFENKYNLKYRKILDLNYWDFCRMNIFYEIRSNYEKTNLIADITKKVSLKDKKINILLIKNYLFLKVRNHDLLFISDPRRIKQNNKYESTFIDPITNELKNYYKIITLEDPNWRAWGYGMPAHFYPTNSINLKYIDLFEFKYIVKKFNFRLFNKKKIDVIKQELDYLYTIIEKDFNVEISYTKNTFVDIILYFLLMKKTYSNLIKKINPKIVLINYRPTYFKMLINSICRENNIATVDLQHGVISIDDPLERKNPNGFDLLTTSDYLFAYGEKLVDKTNLCFKKENIKYVGYPFLEKKCNNNVVRPYMLNDNYKYILIISQSLLGENFANFASNLAIKLKEKKEYKIIFKYHPNELHKTFKCLEKTNIIQIKNLEYEIYQFQKYCYCQIGSYSTGLFEGLNFQKPTIIINNFHGSNGTLKILDYFKKGVYSISNEDQLLNIIDSLEKPLLTDTKKLWKTNSINNIKNEIENIIKK